MAYHAEFSGWKNVDLEDLVVAYRKAKADCFFENTFPTAIKFAEYEQNLLGNLESLLKRLHEAAGFINMENLLGDFRLLPKKLSIKPKKNAPVGGHVHFSNPNRAVEHLIDCNDFVPEFRIVGDFPVDSHILSALWINTIGHKFDARLHESCYGARLRRIRDDELVDAKADRPFHISAIGSFSPYFGPYQKWRSDGLRAIRCELEKERDIVAVSLDLKSYYHLLDPLALGFDAVIRELGLELELTVQEKAFTRELTEFLNQWSIAASRFAEKIGSATVGIPGGLVIGLTASRVISNVMLHRWDKLIKEKVAPIHYGRYVDDMFLVLRDTGAIRSSRDLMLYLKERLGKVVRQSGQRGEQIWNIQQGAEFQGKSKIQLQADKQKLFVLQGRAGLDLLDSIEKEINELSSEHRLMPSPDQLEDSTAARVLSAAGSVGDSADTLRRADGLTIRRLSWALQLRHVETLAHDLPSQEWKEQRNEFYEFAFNHILRPDSLFAHFTYLPRLLGFAISLNEWKQAEHIALRAYHSLEQLANAVPTSSTISVNGKSTKAKKELWHLVKGTLTWLFIDAATRYYSPNHLMQGQRSKMEQRLADLFLNGIIHSLTEFEELLHLQFDTEDFDRKAPMVALADLAKEPYKKILRSRAAGPLLEGREGSKGSGLLEVLASADLVNTEALSRFFKSTRISRLSNIEPAKRKNESYLPYLFPTRPLTPAEISELAPECVGLREGDGSICEDNPSAIWAQYTQALRGVWIKPTLTAAEQDNAVNEKPQTELRYIKIGTERKRKVTIALTNLKTEDQDWAAMACNKPNLSRERYQRISDLVNQSIRLTPRPDYVLFPELSIPLPWVDSLAARLNRAGISLIAGTEYRHYANNRLVSEACMVLVDNRLGYPASVKIWQPKLQPAVGEDRELTAKFGKTWATSKLRWKREKPVYIHNNFHFGVMVCSELQNSKARIEFQGDVDALFVLSWNPDLETFASLIESAALDIHAYTILVNNRKYGDSRVRVPAKESFMRDLARVRGGDNDFVVAATLNIEALRSFQSRAKRWPEAGDEFKPLPEGFILNEGRRKYPPA